MFVLQSFLHDGCLIKVCDFSSSKVTYIYILPLNICGQNFLHNNIKMLEIVESAAFEFWHNMFSSLGKDPIFLVLHSVVQL